MLEGMVPGLPPAALRQIVGRAEGIPLYAVETVRMLLDKELLVPEEGRYRLDRRHQLGRRRRDASGADRVAARRRQAGGPLGAAGRIGPGPDLHAGRALGGDGQGAARRWPIRSSGWSAARC